MALNPSNSSNLEQLMLKGLNHAATAAFSATMTTTTKKMMCLYGHSLCMVMLRLTVYIGVVWVGGWQNCDVESIRRKTGTASK